MQKNTSWNKVSDWYKQVPKGLHSQHQEVIIPKLMEILDNYLFAGAKVLDLACGEGTVTAELANAGFAASGFDLAPKLIATAKANYPEIPFTVADAQHLPAAYLSENKAKFDAVISVLALQNIPELGPVMENVAKLTASHGYFIMVLNHPAFRIPKFSAWGYEENKKQYRIVEKYMNELKLPITAHPGEKNSAVTWSFHRPLSKYMQLLQQNNFAAVAIEEWVSRKASDPGPRARAEDEARREIPLFMTIIAKKWN